MRPFPTCLKATLFSSGAGRRSAKAFFAHFKPSQVSVPHSSHEEHLAPLLDEAAQDCRLRIPQAPQPGNDQYVHRPLSEGGSRIWRCAT